MPDARSEGSSAWRVCLASGVLATLTYYLMPVSSVRDLVFYNVIAFSGVAVIFFGIRVRRPTHPLAWYLFAAGLLMFLIADIVYSVYEYVGADSFPSLADAFYLGGYLPIAAGLMVLIRGRTPGDDRASFVDATIVAVSLGMLSWVFLMAPYARDPSLSLLGRWVLISYPLADVLLLVVLARFLFAPGTRTPAYYLLALSLLAYVICDTLYAAGVLASANEDPSLINAGYLLSYVLWGAAALHPTMGALSEPARELQAKPSRKRLMLLGAVSLVGPAVLAIQAARDVQVGEPVVVVGSVVLFLLTLVRMEGLLSTLTAALTRQEKDEEALRESEERFRSLADATFEGILISDKGNILQANEVLLNMFGYKLEEVVGESMLKFIAPEYHAQVRESILSDSKEPYAIVGLGRDGIRFELEVRGKSFVYQGRPVRVNAVRDITQNKAFERRLQHLAFHDSLTNLPNRALFMDRLKHCLAKLDRREGKVAVLFLDLDNFKVINDSLGHVIGDQLLVKVAERLSACLRLTDTAARLVGDEYTVLLENVEDVSEVTRVAGRILESLQTPFAVEGQELHVTTSIGVAISGYSEDPVNLLRTADLAMYWAKAKGKNLYEIFEQDMDVLALERLWLERDLRRALKRDEFRVYYQPQVSLKSGRIVGKEALVRWEHPERGLVSPVEFIPVAEETGLIIPIGHRVLEEACRQAREWHAQYPAYPPLKMSVNLSARQFQHPSLVHDLARILEETGLEACSLTLEITESIMLEDMRSAIETLKALKSLGVKVAVDDFGTGYSSLSYLKRFPVDCLKIDRSFVSGLGRDPEDRGLVLAVIEMANTLGLEVIAEGVETENQLEHLRELGCELAQGFYFWKPSPGDVTGMLLASRIHV